MNPHLKNYLNSFKLRKDFFYTLAVEGGFWGIISLVLVLVGKLLEKKALELSQGRTAEQLQEVLLTLSSEQLQAFLSSLKEFLIIFVVGLAVIGGGGFLLYSLSRKLIWNHLLKEKTKYWRWNLLSLVLAVLGGVYLLIFGISKVILSYLISLLGNQTAITILDNLINLAFLLVFLIFAFLAGYSFNQRYKVWLSIGEAFSLIRTRWSRIWRMFLLGLGTAIVLGLILWPLGKQLTYRPTVLMAINLAVSLVFLTWMRVYTARTVKD